MTRRKVFATCFKIFYLQVDLSESVIDEKESLIKSDDYGDDLSAVQSLIVKQVAMPGCPATLLRCVL